jgi:hypothetical protein
LTSSTINSFLMSLINSSLILSLFTKTSLLYRLHSPFFFNFVFHFSILSSSFLISSTFSSHQDHFILFSSTLFFPPFLAFPFPCKTVTCSPHNLLHSYSSRKNSGERYLSAPFYVPYTVCNCAHLIKHSLKSRSKNLNKCESIDFFHGSHCDPVWNYIFPGTYLQYLAPKNEI